MNGQSPTAMDTSENWIIAPDDPGAEARSQMLEAKVLKVFDGDGFLAEIPRPSDKSQIKEVSLRLAFIDAPEMDQLHGAEAGAYLQRLIGGKTLSLELIGKESAGYAPIDPYKRVLCMAYLTEDMPTGDVEYFHHGKCDAGEVRRARSVTRNVELELIVNGWAWVTQQYTFEHEDEYFAAQDIARSARRGLWAMNNPEPPWRFKQRQKARRKIENQQSILF